MRWVLAATLLAPMVFLGTACKRLDSPEHSPKVRPTSNLDWKTILDKATDGAGKVSQIHLLPNRPPVIVFEEIHNSRASQVEIAQMLVRLYQSGNLRDVAMEGYIQGEPSKTEWMKQSSLAKTDKILQANELLMAGDLHAGEFLAFAIDDVRLHAVESKEEYNDSVRQKGESVGLAMALWVIAVSNLSPEAQAAHENTINSAKDPGSVIMELIQNDTWCRPKHDALMSIDHIVSTAEELALIEEIKAKFEPLKSEVPGVMEQLEGYRQFITARARASVTMAHATSDVLDELKGRPIALQVGAAHTAEICSTLSAADQAYVVVTPDSIRVTDWSEAAMEQRGVGQLASGDALSALFRAMGNRMPPKSVADSSEIRDRTRAIEIIERLASSDSGSGGPSGPPSGTDIVGFSDDSPRRRIILIPAVDIDRRSEGGIIFKAIIYPDDPQREQEVWIRCINLPAGAMKSADGKVVDIADLPGLEHLLQEDRSQLRAGTDANVSDLRAAGYKALATAEEKGRKRDQEIEACNRRIRELEESKRDAESRKEKLTAEELDKELEKSRNNKESLLREREAEQRNDVAARTVRISSKTIAVVAVRKETLTSQKLGLQF